MNTSKARAEIAALREAALEDLMATTDAELRHEAVEDGEELGAVAAQIRAAMRDTAAATLRLRLTRAKDRLHSELDARVSALGRPSLEQIKALVQNLFQTDRTLGLAFRDGRKQTDADWLSLYDDLVAMGVIEPHNHGH